MKKLLIIAYDFPPYVSVGGLRPYNWYMYLSEFQITPVVITRQWSNEYRNYLDYVAPSRSKELVIEKNEFGTIYKTPYRPNLSNRLLLRYGDRRFKFIRKLISGFFEITQFFFNIGPKSALYSCARNYLKENKVDAIIATGDPFVLFSYASKLSSEFGIPWIADYRDTWVQDKTRSSNKLIKGWNAYNERRFLKNVTLITTVSQFIALQIKQNIPNKPFHIIHNGFNPSAIANAQDKPQESKDFTISFAGTIYNWHPIKSFLDVCDQLLATKSFTNFQLKFYGINNQSDLEFYLRQKKQLEGKIIFHPKMENEDLVLELCKANAFLLFNDYSILGTKIFTYLGLRRKIILCYSQDPKAEELKKKYFNLEEFDSESKQLQTDLIHETNAGIVVKNEAHLMNVLDAMHTEFIQNGFIACPSEGIEKYSRKIQVEKLAACIKTI